MSLVLPGLLLLCGLLAAVSAMAAPIVVEPPVERQPLAVASHAAPLGTYFEPLAFAGSETAEPRPPFVFVPDAQTRLVAAGLPSVLPLLGIALAGLGYIAHRRSNRP